MLSVLQHIYMWQSRVEIEHYSVKYFEHFMRSKHYSAELIKGGAHMHCIDAWMPDMSTQHVWTQKLHAIAFQMQ